MVLRLSELLDRIRPAGAPGTPAAAVPQRDVVAREETARVVDVLAEFEAEVDALLACARVEADAIAAEADRTARQIRNELPDRVAVARADVADDAERAHADAIARVGDDAEAEAATIRAAADAGAIAQRVIAVIWDAVGEERPQ